MKTIASLIAVAGCVMAGGPVLAQAPGGAMAMAPAVSAATVALPGDDMGTGRRMGPPPGAPKGASPNGLKAFTPPVAGNTVPTPSLAVALKAAQVALATCKAEGYNIGVAVIDSAGTPRVGLSEDNATGGHIYTAVRKGLTALAFKEPTSKVTSGMPGITAKMAPIPGAVPLFAKNGELLGAIGGSKATGAEDEHCAQTGADAVKAEL